MKTTPNKAVGASQPSIFDVLHQAADSEASDIHLVPGWPVTFRIHGEVTTAGSDVLDPKAVREQVEAILPDNLRERLGEGKNFDCSISLEHHGAPRRFRANVYLAQGSWCASLRFVPNEIPSLDWMGFPKGLAQRMIGYTNGLVITTGITGSGKTTTLAALLQMINQEGGKRVLTIEEPIEYVHPPISSTVVTQREVGRDVDSFSDGLKHGLRQDPDIILVGEIRDPETARMALSAAETGHLIFATLHTKDAKGAITRLVDLFPRDAQDDIRTQLSLSVRTIVSQHLLPSAIPNEKRVLALEILHATQPVRSAIKQGKIESIDSAIQTGRKDGMMTLDDHLRSLVEESRITAETARRFAKDAANLGG